MLEPNSRRRFLSYALASAGAVVAGLFARTVAYAKIARDPLVRDMSKRTANASFDNRHEEAAALCNKASCNPGCQDGCSAGCLSACKTGKK